jgi:hypothetical protein
LENLNDSQGTNRENTKENIKPQLKGVHVCMSVCLYELRQHKLLCVEECLGFLHQRNRVKMEWLQDPNESNAVNLNSVKREASRYFRNKQKECLIYIKLITLKLTVS